MEIHERIKYLRKDILGMTREKFGEYLGVSGNVIANIEYNRLARPDQKEPLLKLICQISWNGKKVNEDWLLNESGGDNNIFLPEDMSYIYNIGRLGHEKNEFKKFYLNMMLDMPEEYWDYIYGEFMKFQKNKK